MHASDGHRTGKGPNQTGVLMHRSVVLDTETTGLDPEEDEILELSIISADMETSGEVLYSRRLRPQRVQSWPSAQIINGISPDMVADAPTVSEEMPVINGILKNVDVVICYNADFDLSFIRNSGVTIPEIVSVVDVMLDFAEIFGEYSWYTGDYKLQSLATCASYYGYSWGDDTPHSSLADCRATLYCWQQMHRRDDA